MSHKETEWVTPPLPESHWPEAIKAVLNALQSLGIETLELMHGWSASDFEESPEFARLQWRPETIGLAHLPQLLRQRQRLGFCLGHDDLLLTLSDGTEIRLCLEGNLRLRTADETFVRRLNQTLLARNITLSQYPSTLSP